MTYQTIHVKSLQVLIKYKNITLQAFGIQINKSKYIKFEWVKNDRTKQETFVVICISIFMPEQFFFKDII